MKYSLFLILTLITINSYAQVTFKCIAEETYGAKKIDHLLIDFPSNTKDVLHNNGTLTIFWEDGQDEIIKDKLKNFYMLKSTHIFLNFKEYKYYAYFTPNSRDDWFSGVFNVKGIYYYNINCVMYSTP